MRAIIYAAKSTTDQHGSIPTQLEDGRRMAAREGWEAAGEYADEAASAYHGDRGPQLAAAMEHVAKIAPAVLVVQHSDRLARGDGRSARHLGELYFWAIKAGVELRSVQDDSTFTNPLLTFAMGERNAEDSRRKALAVKAGMVRRAEKGLATGGPRPYGYRYDTGDLVVVDAERPIVVRIFAEFVAGVSMTSIARRLHEDGVPTLRGKHWRQSTVGGILANPVYSGRIRYDGEVRDGGHKPIVDAETWASAQALLAARPSKGRGRPPAGRHLFRGGMLRCECGEAIVPRTNGGYEMYYCNGRSTFGREHCDVPHIRRAVIDSAVYRYFEQVGLDVEASRQAIAEASERKLAEVAVLRADAERELQQAEERLTRVRRDYSDGKLDAADWREFRVELTAEREGAAAEAKRLRASEVEIKRAGAMADAEEQLLTELTEIRRAIAGEVQAAESVAAVRAVLARMFAHFVLRRSLDRVHVELLASPEYWIEPVLAGGDEGLQPGQRAALATNNDSASRAVESSPLDHAVFGPIPVGVGS